ncbi:MAG: hypothetical protein M1831_000877 [Alyxoria varia]|nr:MAG: hypothetical protein M1831_000877 [Alyxoria varia]
MAALTSSSQLSSASKPPGILKTPASSRKRPSEDLSSPSSVKNSATGSASPQKRLKVAFDTDDEIIDLGEAAQKSLIQIREEVGFALRQHAIGDHEEYQDIIDIFKADVFSHGSPPRELLAKYIVALTANVGSLDRNCSDLVHSVLQTEWLGRDEAFVINYIRFLSNLVSSHGTFIPDVLDMLVQKFPYLSTSTGELPGHEPVQREALYDRTHKALHFLHQSVPSASGILSSIITSNFPFLEGKTQSIVEYVRNLLKMPTYAPELRAEVLDLIIERLVKIDVDAQMAVDDLDEDIDELLDSTAEDDEDGPSDDESIASDDTFDNEKKHEKELRSKIQKMDAILDLLFTFYNPIFKKPNAWSSQSTFDHLLAQFQKNVLPTFRSRHTQFVIFHFSQADEHLVTRFTDTCIKNLTDQYRNPTIRESAAAYLASFIARGARVSRVAVNYAFNALSRCLENFRTAWEPSARGPNLQRYSIYYATFQALMYIFCFRWRDLILKEKGLQPVDEDSDSEDDEGDDTLDLSDLFLNNGGKDLLWAPHVKEIFSCNFQSKLNPLKVCAPSIVEEFARAAHALRFAYIYHILEANKRVRFSTASQYHSQYSSLGKGSGAAAANRETALNHAASGAGSGANRFNTMEAYFPFDPYRLPVSKRWLEGEYREYKGVGMPSGNQAEGNDSGDEDDDEEDEESDEEMGEELEGTETPED